MLNLVLAVIAGMQAPIIMMSQNRQGEKDRLRADLDYQVNLKNELSLTEVLRRLDVLESERLPKLFEDAEPANRECCEVGPKSKVQRPKAKDFPNSTFMIKAIFFDFNGVIIDDETIQMNAYQEVFKGHGIDVTEEWYFDSLGMDDKTFVRSMFRTGQKALPDPLLEECWDED